MNELSQYNPELLDKTRVLAITKSDLADEEILGELKRDLPDIPYVFISSLTCKYMREKKELIHTILYRRIIIIVFGVCVVSAAIEWCWFSDIHNFVYKFCLYKMQ